MDRDKTINVIFYETARKVVLSDLPIFGIISTKGQSFHTVEALIVKPPSIYVDFCMKIIFNECVVRFDYQRNALYSYQMLV